MTHFGLASFGKKVKVIMWLVGLGFAVPVWGQADMASLVLEGSGGKLLSIVALHAYPVQHAEKEMGVATERKFQTDLMVMKMTAAVKAGGGWFSVGARQARNGVMARSSGWLAFSLPISETWTVGLRLGGSGEFARGYEGSVRPRVGIGWLAKLGDKLIWRMQVDGLEAVWKGNVDEYAMRTGLFMEVSRSVSLSADLLLEDSFPPVVVVGIHYAFAENWFGRIGSMSTLHSIGLGAGFRRGALTLEVFSGWHNIMGISSNMAICWKFKSK